MKLTELTKKKWNYCALAFIIPFAGLLLLRLISTIAFNGVYSMLYSDQYHQYYPFFVAFRKALLSGDSLLYNWSVGMGMDYLGLISYYLASPLNLLCVLVPESLTLAYFSLLMPLKLSFAGLFFAIFLKKIFRRNDFSVTVFGCFYALCAWALGYHWNIMWLDTFALLPLVMLGMVSLLRDKKFVLYTVTLFLSIFANYYIGLFTCIFVFLTFFCYEICRWRGFGRFFGDLLRIAFFSLLAIGMTALLSLPALAALQTTYSSVNTFPTGFRLNIADQNTWKGLLDAMRQVAGNMNGGLEPNFKSGLPNIYCGIIMNILAFLFLTCKQVKLRDKICSVVLLLFFNVSFVIRQLDYIWHGFHFTNMIPYRFSFLYSFVVLYMAYRAWLLRRSFRIWQIITAGVLAIGLMLCSNDFYDFFKLVSGEVTLQPWDNSTSIVSNLQTIATHCTYVAYNTLFLVAYLATFLYAYKRKPVPENLTRKKKASLLAHWRDRRKMGAKVLTCIMLAELVLNVTNFGAWFPGTNIVNYPHGTVDAERAIRYMHEQEEDTLFYRAEMTHTQTLNDAALNGFNGISTFTSSANVKVTEFMQALGYGARNNYNRYSFEESSPVANLFLDLKYMLEREGRIKENPYFDEVHHFNKVYLLENNAYLPLGFMANTQLLDVNFAEAGNRFTFQNKLLRAASGINLDVWKTLSGKNLVISGKDVILSNRTQAGYCSYSTQQTSGSVIYTYTASQEGFLCVHLELSKQNNFSFWLNGKELYSETYSLPQMLSVTNMHPGDVVEIKLSCRSNEKGTINISAALLDESVFRQCYDVLAASPLELTKFRNTLVEGTVNCTQDGLLYTSIPQDGNWTVTVDGQSAETVLIGDAMTGVQLTEGTHTVRFTYRNAAFSLGWKISLGCLIVFLACYWFFYQPSFKKAKGKYEK